MTNHLEQAATGMMILFVLLQMLREIPNTSRQNSNLHLRRTRIALMDSILIHQILISFQRNLE